MQMPNVENVLNDPTQGVKYRVMAYRALSRPELLQAVAMHLRKQRGKKSKPGTVITILTVIGIND